MIFPKSSNSLALCCTACNVLVRSPGFIFLGLGAALIVYGLMALGARYEPGPWTKQDSLTTAGMGFLGLMITVYLVQFYSPAIGNAGFAFVLALISMVGLAWLEPC
jgi:hypothetical protein